MVSRYLGGLLVAAAFAGACAADPGDGPKGDAGAVMSSFDSGGSTSGGGSGSSSSGGSTAPPPGDDATTGTTPPPSDGASPPTPEASPPPPPPPSCTTCPLTVEYFSDSKPDMSSVKFHVSITNNGTMSQALSDLTLRYWFTADGIANSNFSWHMYYAALSTITTQTIAVKFVSLGSSSTPPATATSDTYMELSFMTSAGSIPAMGATNDIQLEFGDSTYQGTQSEANDYSHTGSDTQSNCEGGNNVLTCQTMTITLYRSGMLVWGNEPGGAMAPGPDAGSQPPADAASQPPADQ
jgi:hypothetical protein